MIPTYGAGAPQEYLPRAKAAATKAVELDDSLAEAHTSLGRALICDFKAAESAKEFERAIELNPNYATAHHWYGRLTLPMLGDLDRAMIEAKRAVELDPVSPIIRVDIGSIHLLARRYDKAIAQYRDTLEMSPEFYFAYRFMGLALELKGATEEAMAEYRTALQLSDEPKCTWFDWPLGGGSGAPKRSPRSAGSAQRNGQNALRGSLRVCRNPSRTWRKRSGAGSLGTSRSGTFRPA
jgi:tetratricopeptide (TPR) repeat protein